jgi:phosphoribosylglycinamide formyltransferase-1
MTNLGVLASGRGTNLQAIIDAIEAGKLSARISVVASDNPDARALRRAKKHGIKTEVITKKDYPEKDGFDSRLISALDSAGVELVALAGFMRILTGRFIRHFHMRTMNIHPSLLPAFSGLDAQRKALEWGVRFSGCTVHFVDEGVDTGPIIMQAVVPVRDGDTTETLSERILEMEHKIYPRSIQLYSEGRLIIKGRRVFIKGAEAPEGSMENPFLFGKRKAGE